MKSGTTINFTWRANGVTVAITPAGGSTTTISTSDDGTVRRLEEAIRDYANCGSPLPTVTQRLNASKTKLDGLTHIE